MNPPYDPVAALKTGSPPTRNFRVLPPSVTSRVTLKAGAIRARGDAFFQKRRPKVSFFAVNGVHGSAIRAYSNSDHLSQRPKMCPKEYSKKTGLQWGKREIH